MKLIVDIPKKDYQKIHSGEKIIELSCNIAHEIANGIPLEHIRAEIEQSRYGLVNDGLDLALKIIDKYAK